MGQPIEVTGRIVLDDVLVLDTDRGITGQDGFGFARDEAGDESFSGRLARRIFEGDDAVDHVFVASAQVVVRRPGGWDEASIAAVARAVEEFFVFYKV